MVKKQNDHSWDLIQSEKGNLPQCNDAWEKKYDEWVGRDWLKWLNSNLSFPFEVKRFDDDNDAYSKDITAQTPFSFGHVMQVLSLVPEDGVFGLIAKVQEGDKIGEAPLFDLEVTSKDNENYWAVREYVVWDANK